MVTVRDAGALRFYDDAPAASLNRALAESISFWQQQRPARWIRVCDRSYRAGRLLDSLLEFQKLLHSSAPAELSAAIGRKFTIYQAQNSSGGSGILVTGYFQPVFAGSLSRRPPYIYPIYGLPPDLIHARRHGASGKSKTLIGRLVDGRLQPYWRRSEIEDKNLLAGRELLYLRDPVDAFFLQVQGSGLVVLPDGSRRQVLYAGSNGWPYRSIGRLLVAEGRLSLSEVSMPKIRQYLLSHLDERRHILHYNNRYIFFRLAPDTGEEPIGAMGHELTPGRSVALDVNCFPLGGLGYLTTEIPRIAGGRIVGWRSMRRFVLAQDSGAAIKGSGRLDVFWGHGPNAGKIAGKMRQPGKLYILIKK
ncbi:MAG: transglycosylase [Deltaproteobacteria bacterium]|nr:transglycosylase [Deltaproteobacteria bacterium]